MFAARATDCVQQQCALYFPDYAALLSQDARVGEQAGVQRAIRKLCLRDTPRFPEIRGFGNAFSGVPLDHQRSVLERLDDVAVAPEEEATEGR